MVINHEILSEVKEPYRNGYDVTVRLTDSETKEDTTITFWLKEKPDHISIEARVSHLINNFEHELNPLNNMDIGDGSQRMIDEVVFYVGKNPNCSYIDLSNNLEIEKPDSMWKSNKFVDEMMKEAKIAEFEDFKHFIINKKFSGISEVKK